MSYFSPLIKKSPSYWHVVNSLNLWNCQKSSVHQKKIRTGRSLEGAGPNDHQVTSTFVKTLVCCLTSDFLVSQVSLLEYRKRLKEKGSTSSTASSSSSVSSSSTSSSLSSLSSLSSCTASRPSSTSSLSSHRFVVTVTAIVRCLISYQGLHYYV